jgi:hypothetical protein
VQAREHVDSDEPEADSQEPPRRKRLVRRNRSPRRIVKSGTVAWAIAATPESTCCSPHAMSQNGTAFAITPSTAHCRHEARSSETARRVPRVTAR